MIAFIQRQVMRLFGDATGELAQKVVKGGLWQFASRMLMRSVNLVSWILVARLLSREDVGVANAAMIVVAWATGLTQLGLEGQVMRMGDRAAEYLPTTFFVRIVRSVFLGGLIAATSPWTAELLRAPESQPLIVVLGVNFALGGLSNAGVLLMVRDLQVKNLALRAAFDTFLSAVVTVGVAYVTRSYWAITLGTLATTISALVNSYLVTRVRVKPRFVLSHFKELYAYGKWVSITNSVNFVATNLESPIVARLAGPDGLAVYSNAGRLAAIPGQELSAAAMAVLFSGLAAIRHEIPKLRRAMEQVIVTATKLILPVSIFMAFFADPIVRIILGEKWAGSAPLFAAMLAGAVISPTGLTGGTFIGAITIPKITVFTAILRAAIFLSIIWPLEGAYGLVGLIIASHVSSGIMGLLLHIEACRLMGVKWAPYYFYPFRQAIPIAAICGGGWWLASQVPNLWLQIVIGLPFFGLAQFVAMRTAWLSLPWKVDQQLEGETSQKGGDDPEATACRDS